MNVRRTTAAAAAVTLLAVPAATASAAPAQVFRGDLVDLSAATADPFGDASAHLVMTETVKSSQTSVWSLTTGGVAVEAL